MPQIDNQALMTQKMQRVFDEADCLYSLDTIAPAIADIGQKITQELADKNPVIISVMNGGLVFTGQLLMHLHFPMQLDYLHATRYRDNTQGGGLDWLVRPNIDLSGRVVLVVDDILDEGHTLKQVLEYCQSQGAQQVLSAVLFNKAHDRKAFTGFKADFEGLLIADRFVFGFGMDYQGYWRNAPGLYAVKGM
jgi:hypoxanthine phosphoribosyltransferase